MKNISSHIRSQLPQYVSLLYTENENDSSVFELFVKAYYEWCEQTGNVNYLLSRAEQLFDVDKVFINESFSKFRDYFFRTFLPGIPKTVLVNKAFLVKHGREFYLNKGNENSFRFLFKILYNEDIDIFIPNTRILTTNDKVKGRISEDCKIHDSFFWQQFSYEITSEFALKEYRDLILNLLHPAGMKLFGKFLAEIEVKMTTQAFVEFFINFLIEVYVGIIGADVNLNLIFANNFSNYGSSFASLFLLTDLDYNGNNYVLGFSSSVYSGSNTEDTIFLKILGLDFPTNTFNGWKIGIIDGTGSNEEVQTIQSFINNGNHIEIQLEGIGFSIVPDDTSEYILFQELPSKIGLVQGATGATVQLSSIEYSVDDFYNNAFNIKIVSGNGVGEEKQIIDYDGSTKTATVDSLWTTEPNTSSVYIINKYSGNETDYFESSSSYSIQNFLTLLISNYYSFGELGINNNNLKDRTNFSEIELLLYK